MEATMSIHKRYGKRGVTYQVRHTLPDGKKVGPRFKTKKEAELFQAELRLDQGEARGMTRVQRKTTFLQVAESWTRLKDLEHSTKTKIRRDQILRDHLLPKLAHLPVRNIKPSHFRDLVTGWREQGLSPYSIRNHIACARPIFKLAIEDGIITKDPTAGLKLAVAPRRVPTVLTQSECQTLLLNVDDGYRAAFYTLLATGVRISEFMRLKVGDVDFVNKVLRIRKSKTRCGVRDIALSTNDLQVLKAEIERWAHLGGGADAPLFRSVRGKALHYRNLRERVLLPTISRSALPRFTFHDLRRTHATMLVAAGIDPKVVQQRMGHASIETTLKYYAQATEERRIAASEVAVAFLALDEHLLRTA